MGLDKINNKPLDYIEDESSEERSLFEKKSNEKEETKQLRPEDFDMFDEEELYNSEKQYLEDLKKQLEEHKAQMNNQIAFKSAFDEPKNKTR